MNKNTNLSYYYNGAEPDNFPFTLTYFDSPLYFLLKNHIENLHNPSQFFLRDITFYISQKKDGSICDINFLDNSINSDVFKLERYPGKGIEATHHMEELLDKGEIVLVQTDSTFVPFLKYFMAENIYEGQAYPGHIFLIVGHDQNSYYYVENPQNVNNDRFIPHPENLSIGIVKKSDLRKAFASFLNCITVKISDNALVNNHDRILVAFRNSISNYKRKTVNHDELKFTYGKEAFKTLVKVIKKNSFYMDIPMESYSLTLFGLMNWRLNHAAKRRLLLKQYLYENMPFKERSKKEKLFCIFNDNIKAWFDTVDALRKSNQNKTYLFSTKFLKHFKAIEKQEKRLYTQLKKLKIQFSN